MRKITLLLAVMTTLYSLNTTGQTYLTENFDASIPATWTIDDAGGATGDSWISGQQAGANDLDGSNAAIVDSDADGDGVLLIETLTSPAFDTTGATAIILEFDQFYRNIGSDTATVEVWDGTAWIPVLTQTATAGAFNAPDQQSINLTAFSNVAMQVRFVYNDDDSWAWYWLIDNVTIYNATCANPQNLTFISATDSTANLSWSMGGTEAAWEIVVQPQGTGVPTGAGTATITNNPHVEMGLISATSYEAYIRADCGGDFSAWVGPLNFATECTTFVAPYTEGFENGGTIPLCWSMDGGEDWDFNLTGPNHVGNGGTITGTTLTGNYYAVVDASGTDAPSTLTTPLIDVSGLTTPAITFYQISDNEGDANSQLDVEVWDGAAWNLMATYNTNTAGWEERIINISALNITGDVQARFIFSEVIDPSAFDDDIAIDDVTFDELPSCANPSTLAIDNTTDTSVTLSWIANGTETAWEVVVQAPGTGTPTGAGTAAPTNPFTEIGLTTATTYEAYVRADCGTEFSDWIGPISFITECATFVAPYTQGFENAGTIPVCWSMSGGEDWNFDDVAPGFGHIGANGTITGTTLTNGYFAWVDASADNGPTILTSPLVDVSGLTTPSLSFFEISDNEGEANSQLDVEVWDGAAWNLMGTYNTNTAGWEERVINMSTLTITGNVQARFTFSEPVPADFYDDIAIDDVTFDELPSCTNPSNLVLDSATDTTATFSWMVNGIETAWEVVVQAPGTGLPVGAGTGTSTNPNVTTGLTAATDYEIYIRADCGTEFSDWIGPLTFTTECATFVAPYTEGFENGGDIPTCWTMSGGEDWNFNDVVPAFGHVGNNGVITGTTLTNNYFAWVDASGNDGPTILVSPFVDVSGLTNPGLSFYEISNNEGDDNSQLDVEVWDGAAWNLMGTYNTNTTGWELKIINIGTLNITGDVQARFIFSELISPFDFSDDIAIDDVTFDELPPCLFPNTITVANTTETSFDISWLPGAGETAWEYIVQPSGTGAPTGAGTPTTVTTAMIDMLMPGTVYEVYVRSDCNASGDGYSDWAGPVNFITLLANDDCDGATVSVVNDSFICEMSTPGTLFGATASAVPNPSCGGNPDDDVWFQFVATSEFQLIALANIQGSLVFDIDHAVYEGTCGVLTEISCTTGFNLLSSVTPQLTIGNTYYIRVFSNDSDQETTTFDLCITPYIAPTNVTCDLTENLCPGGGDLYTYNTVDVIPGLGQIDCLGSSPNPTFSVIEIGSSGDINIEIVQNTAFDSMGNAIGNPLDVDFALWGPFNAGDDYCNGGDFPSTPVTACSFSGQAIENFVINAAVVGDIYIVLITNFDRDPGIIQINQTNLDPNNPDPNAGTLSGDISVELASNDTGFIDDDNDENTPSVANLCGFNSITLDASSPFADTFEWFVNGVLDTSLTTPSITITESNTYTVIAYDNQCMGDDTKTVIVNLFEEAIVNVVSPDEVSIITCDDESGDGIEDFNLDGLSAIILDAPGQNPADFLVTYHETLNEAQTGTNAIASPYSAANATIIHVRVEDINSVGSGSGCASTNTTFELTVLGALPTITGVEDLELCDDVSQDGVEAFDLEQNTPIILNGQDPAVFVVSYYMSQADADSGMNALVSPYDNISNPQTIYARIQNNAASDCFKTTTFDLTIGISPMTSFDSSIVYEVCPNATVPITVSATSDNYTASEVTIAWYNEGVLVSGQTGLTIDNVLTTGTYTIEVMFNETGCTATQDVFVEELETCVIPQGISPNGDGLNDTFDLSSFDVQSLKIFNRNGRLVYEKTTYLDEWHGQSLDGDELPVGTYYYVMNYQGTKTKAAWIYINRESN